ncbi:MAG: PIN domain-containing protein [bacterium]
MNIFVDTSAFLAVIDADDFNHRLAKKIWDNLITTREELGCTNYILLETFALMQRRFGIETVKIFQEDVCPIIDIYWIRESDHLIGVNAVITTSRRKLSLVDCISFTIMRQLQINKAFSFDPHFKEQGFNLISDI